MVDKNLYHGLNPSCLMKLVEINDVFMFFLCCCFYCTSIGSF
jgi:hypothetical protein